MSKVFEYIPYVSTFTVPALAESCRPDTYNGSQEVAANASAFKFAKDQAHNKFELKYKRKRKNMKLSKEIPNSAVRGAQMPHSVMFVCHIRKWGCQVRGGEREWMIMKTH